MVAAATVAMFLSVFGLARMASQPGYALLYGGLEPMAAGEVVRALEDRSVPFQVRGSGIYVDSAQRDQLRMSLAGEGLPANGGAGYELLDGLSGFGTTAQMFDAAYWRAKEGELARTIAVNPRIRSARVHIANVSSSPFQRSQKPSASVTVTPNSGAISDDHARALRFLVSSAVAGLLPEDVSVIDGESGRVLGENAPGVAGTAKDEAALKARVERLLEARVGPGNAIVEVSVERATERESIIERRFDPDSRVAISTDTEERSTQSQDASEGSVTVASNLPDGDAQAGGQSSSQNAETRERVNFEVSETQREILREPGTIKRLSVAVLVDGVRNVAADGSTNWQPRTEEELADLQALVASAVGIDEGRGDQLTIRSLEFEELAPTGTAATASPLITGALDAMTLVQLGVLAFASLVLGLFVIRPILTSANQTVSTLEGPRDVTLLEGTALPGSLQSDNSAPGVTGIGADQVTLLDGPVAEGQAFEDNMKDGALLPRPGQQSDAAESPVDRLRRLISEREDESLEILNAWVKQPGQDA